MKHFLLLSSLLTVSLLGAGCATPPTNTPNTETPPIVQDTQNTEPLPETQATITQAVPIERNTFEHPSSGISLEYPDTVDFGRDPRTKPYHLEIEIQPLAGLEGTMGYDEETARKNQLALQNGQFGQSLDFSLPGSERVRTFGEQRAQDFMVFGRFEVCDIAFERKLYLIRNDYQIVLTLRADSDPLLPLLSDYTTPDTENCQGSLRWTEYGMDALYQALFSNIAPEPIQTWYDTFERIIETISFDTSSQTSLLLEGAWQSVDDSLSRIEFSSGRKKDFYNNDLMNEGTFELAGDHLTVFYENDYTTYTILKHTTSSLELLHLPRGNTLTYVKQ